MMTNHEMLQAALAQSARDFNCAPGDFLQNRPVVVPAGLDPEAKKYYKEPLTGTLISYGNNVVACIKDEYCALVDEYIHKFEFYHCFEPPSLQWLDERLAAHGQRVCFLSEYYLPDTARLKPLSCGSPLGVLTDFSALYQPQWSNALCEERRELDVLGVGAWVYGELAGLAGCSADCESMWQIGVDVLPEYRKKGIASALTSRLALEIMQRGKVPFYCSAWSNLPSVRNAVKSGFVPAWVELSIQPAAVLEKQNQSEPVFT